MNDVQAESADELTRAQADVFAALWAIAHVGHLLRKADLSRPLPQLLLLLAIAVLHRPSSSRRLSALAIAQVFYWLGEMPLIDNHLYLMGFANLGIIIASLTARSPRERIPRRYLAGTLLVSYSAAAIAKLNAGFFDVHTSCAVKMSRDALSVFGVRHGFSSPVESLLPFAVAGMELLIPCLLLIRGTRRAAVVVVVGFHLTLSLSPTATALDFTFAIFAFLFLFLPASAGIRLRAWIARLLPARPRLRPFLLGTITATIALSVAMGWGSVPPRNPNWIWLATTAVALGTLLVALSRSTTRDYLLPRTGPPKFRVPYIALVIIQFANVGAPHLGSKNVGSFVMYSNLQTAGGQSNHFLIPRLPLAMGQDDLVEIVDTSNTWLRLAQNERLLVTWHELRRYLSDDPDASITYRRNGQLHTYQHARDNPALVERDVVLHRLIGHQWFDPVQPRCSW